MIISIFLQGAKNIFILFLRKSGISSDGYYYDTIGAFAPEKHFHNHYWRKYPLFAVFTSQELGMIVVIGTSFAGTKLAQPSTI